jgi:polysaccharide pyruvyl transferase WcaK-like protein
LLITTGARNTEAQDQVLLRSGLAFCESHKLIPLVLTKNSRRFAEKKQEILEAGGKFLEQENLEEAAKLVRSCALHIGGRYHMSILALTVGVPSVVCSVITHKNEWLARDFGQIEIASTESQIFVHAESLLKAARTSNWALSAELRTARQVFNQGLHKVVEADLSSGRHALQRILSGASSEGPEPALRAASSNAAS